MGQTDKQRKAIAEAKKAVLMNRYVRDEAAFRKLVNKLVKAASAECTHERTEACGMDCICKDCGEWV